MKRINIFMSLIIGLLLTNCSESTLEETIPSPEPIPNQTTDYFLEKGALLGIHFGVQKEDASIANSRNFLRYTYFPAWKDLCPGSRVYYMRPDRGAHLGTEVFFWVFQDQEARDYYFPKQDFPSLAFEEKFGSVSWLYTDTTFYKYFQYGWQSSGFSSDYEVIAIKDSVQYEWLQDDALLVFQHYKLKSEVDSLKFRQFLEESWLPRVNANREVGDHISAVLEITRGYRSGSYAILDVFKTLESRNKTFPYEGQPQDIEASSRAMEDQLCSFLEPSPEGEGHYEIIY